MKLTTHTGTTKDTKGTELPYRCYSTWVMTYHGKRVYREYRDRLGFGLVADSLDGLKILAGRL